MIYANFENNSAPKDNEDQNAEESYTNKFEQIWKCKHVAYSYGYKLVCVDDK